MTCFKRDLENQGCCNNWQNGIRTIDGQYPDDNREFKIMEGAGILITPVTAGIKITNAMDPGALEAGQNIELTTNNDKLTIATTDDISISGDLSVGGDAAVTGDASVSGDTTLDGDLSVNGNIYNQGASYESHMEQVYTNDDYIIMRDGAVAALANGQYAGFQVKKYDGTNDGRLVIDKTGTARVGDVGDEQPLLTREESADLNNGEILAWDAANSKAVGVPIDAAPTDGSSNPVSSDGVYDALALKLAITDLKIVFHGNVSPSTAVQSINVGNILIQFGKVTTNDATTTTINLPIAYPDTSYITVMSQTTNATGLPQYVNGCCVTSRATNSFTMYNATNGTNSFNWICMGRNTV